MSEVEVFDALKYRIEVDEYGSRFYYNTAGLWHRENGPAIELADNSKYWYQNGHLHRTDGPAIEWANGDRYWCQNGRLHRTDGPAIEHFDGYREWWCNGVELAEYQVDLNIDFSSFCPNTYDSIA